MNYIEEEKEKIIKELLDSKKIKPGQLINYTQFLELYEEYKEKMSELDFTEVLGISYSNYFNIKNAKKNAKILKEVEKTIIKEEGKEIVEELLYSNKIKVGQLINYEDFVVLHKPYKDKINENNFAQILGIEYNNFRSMKNVRHKGKNIKER